MFGSFFQKKRVSPVSSIPGSKVSGSIYNEASPSIGPARSERAPEANAALRRAVTAFKGRREVINNNDNQSLNKFFRALQNGNLKDVEIYMRGDKDIAFSPMGKTPLMVAYKHPDIVSYLLEEGANINKQDGMQYTPFFAVIMDIGTEREDENTFTVANMLLDNGANPLLIPDFMKDSGIIIWLEGKIRERKRENASADVSKIEALIDRLKAKSAAKGGRRTRRRRSKRRTTRRR